jgi:hypothetical protein
MKAKKGKDIAESMILDDLFEDGKRPLSSSSKTESIDQNKLKKSQPRPPVTNREGDVVELDIDSNASSLSLDSKVGSFKTGAAKGKEGTSTSVLDKTWQLNESKIVAQPEVPSIPMGKEGNTSSSTFILAERSAPKASSEKVQSIPSDSVRQSIGKFAAGRTGGAINPSSASLAQSENLRIAQQRILELEQIMDKMRNENANLITAGEMIRKKADELLAKSEAMEAKYDLDISSLQDEKDILKSSLVSRDKDIEKLKIQIEELELRLNSTMQKVRVRERELENRLELVKMESSAVVRTKDEFVLELKRQTDQLNMELDNYRHKSGELNKQLGEKQEMVKRTVKALRIALTMLEGADEGSVKKVK